MVCVADLQPHLLLLVVVERRRHVASEEVQTLRLDGILEVGEGVAGVARERVLLLLGNVTRSHVHLEKMEKLELALVFLRWNEALRAADKGGCALLQMRLVASGAKQLGYLARFADNAAESAHVLGGSLTLIEKLLRVDHDMSVVAVIIVGARLGVNFAVEIFASLAHSLVFESAHKVGLFAAGAVGVIIVARAKRVSSTATQLALPREGDFLLALCWLGRRIGGLGLLGLGGLDKLFGIIAILL